MQDYQTFEVIKEIDGPNFVQAFPVGRIMTGYQIKTAFRIGPSAARFSEYFKPFNDETAGNDIDQRRNISEEERPRFNSEGQGARNPSSNVKPKPKGGTSKRNGGNNAKPLF